MIRFESTFILCGVIESILVLLTIITKHEIFVLLILWLQNFIYIKVLRRFLRIRRSFQNKEPHFSFFCLFLAVLNILFLLILIFVYFLYDVEEFDLYIKVAYASFSIVISIALFITGTFVQNQINSFAISDPKVYINDKGNSNETLLDRERTTSYEEKQKRRKETSNSIQKGQIIMIIYIGIVTSIYQLIYVFLRDDILYDDFMSDERLIDAITPISVCVNVIYFVLILLTILMNYLAFYFIVRNQYYVKKIQFSKNNIDFFTRQKSNEDIDQFINQTKANQQDMRTTLIE